METNKFIIIENDLEDNLIIKCSGYVVRGMIKTPDDTEEILFISKEKNISQDEIEKYFAKIKIVDSYCRGCLSDYNGEEENILEASQSFIPLTLLFQLYGSYKHLYTININSDNSELDELRADLSYGFGTEYTGYMWLNDRLEFGGHDLYTRISEKEYVEIKITQHSKKNILNIFENKEKLLSHLKSVHGYFKNEETIKKYYFDEIKEKEL